MKNPFKKNLSLFLIVFCAALFVRGIYFYQQQDNPFIQTPLSDAAIYILEAERLQESGNWLGNKVFTFGGGAFYIYFLAVFFTLFGKKLIAVLMLQFVVGGVSSALIGLLGERLFSRTTGFILGIMAAFFAPFLFHEGLLLSSSWTILFLLLSLFPILSTPEPNNKAIFASGVFLGLTVLCRPNFLLLAPCYLFPLLIPGLKTNILKIKPYLLIIGLLLVILPISVKNYLVSADFVLISSGGGWNFYLGNNPHAPGFLHVPPESKVINDLTIYESAHQVAQQESGRQLSPSEGSHYWFKRGLRFIQDEPQTALALYWKKFNLFWNSHELTNIYDFNYFKQFSILLRNPLTAFGVTALLGLVGGCFIMTGGSRNEKLLVLMAFIYMCSVLPFFISSRLREPIAVFLILMAGGFLKKLPRLTLRTAGVALLITLLGSTIIFKPLPEDSRKLHESFAHSYFILGKKLLKQQKYEEALSLFDAALKTDHENIMIMVEAGTASQKLRKPEAAKEYYNQVLPYKKHLPLKVVLKERFSWPDPRQMAIYQADLELGKILYGEGNLKQAEQHFINASTRYQIGLEPHKYLSEIFEKQGNIKDAIRACRNYLKLYPNDPEMKARLNILTNSP